MNRSLMLVPMLLWSSAVTAAVQLRVPPVIDGRAPGIGVAGLRPGEIVRVHVFRMFARWVTDDPARRSGWRSVPQLLHAWAEVRADRRGSVDMGRIRVRAGTYRGVDPYGLLWSGRKVGTAEPFAAGTAGFDPATLRDGESLVAVTRGMAVVARAPLRSVPPPGLLTIEVADGALNGVFAAPAEGSRRPALILLHGSEGGGRDEARLIAQRFAGQGFAAFALNYFAWDLKGIAGVPNVHVNQPIELLTRVRDWLGNQPRADVTRIGVYGHSKGAEYATVAAVYLPWIRAVAACVPSDSVWEGYGIGDGRNRPRPGLVAPERRSSWSWRGQPLPYIALPPADDRSRYADNTAYYEARRRAEPPAAAAARIPVERSRAYFLWLGGGRDRTWASGAMATRNDAVLRRAGKADRSERHVYPLAGHAICGDGTYPTRLWADDTLDPRRPDPEADGRATVDGWRRIVGFFRRRLAMPR